ncbi:peptidoglycan DD-metalloendopeptidase family protein [Deinococcus sp.]|uniref:peptidoglycan DD-metalloendopeptidase family protein n=1 Tax=Deinococcus sp. TaxID=47478 RepID=UPI003B5B3F08
MKVLTLACAALLSCSVSAAGTYRLAPGDNLTVIAKRIGVSLSRLRAANPQISRPSAVRAGTVIKLPDARKPSTAHRVASGESLGVIAAKYRLSLNRLINANPGLSAKKPVQVGQKLYIPGRTIKTSAAQARPKTKAALATKKTSQPVIRAASVRANSLWRWPVQGWISSAYGERSLDGDTEMHYGVDIVVPVNTAVRASKAGRVIESRADFARGWGWTIIVDHGDGWQTRYAHLSRNLARVGDRVVRGQVIGRSGNSGRSTGPHLHYGTYLNGVPKNPLELLD